MPTTPGISFSESMPALGDGILLGFLLLAAIYVVFTGVFYYHWQEYSTDKNVTWLTFVAYGVTTVPLMLIMAVVALSI